MVNVKTILIVLMAFTTILFIKSYSHAYNFEILQITDNSVDDKGPSLHNGSIAWTQRANDENEIVFWNGSDTVQITNNSINDYGPSLNNNQIVWTSYDNGLRSINYWDGNNFTIVEDHYNHNLGRPSLYNGQIAYYKSMPPPGGSGSWQEQIFFWDGTSSNQITDQNDLIAYYSQPSLYNGSIAFTSTQDLNYPKTNKNREIFFWNGEDTIQLTDDEIPKYELSYYDGQIAWVGYDGNDREIYLWDGFKTTQITNNDYDDHYPSLYNGNIAWQGGNPEDPYSWEIFYWDGNFISQVTNNNYQDIFPSLHGEELAWQRWDGNDHEIYLSTIKSDSTPVPEPSTMLLLGVGLTGLVALRRKNKS